MGDYVHPAYGTLSVTTRDSGLVADVQPGWFEGNAKELVLTHYAGDVFNGTLNARFGDGLWEIDLLVAEFAADGSGLGLSAEGAITGIAPPSDAATPLTRAELWFKRAQIKSHTPFRLQT